jgi:hypothetical protein
MADGCLVVRTIVMFGSGTHHLETVTYSLQLTSAVIPVCHLLPSSLPLIKFNVNTPKTVLSYPLFFFLLALWNELANGKLRSFGLREHQNSKLRAPLVLMSSAKHFCAFLLHEVPATIIFCKNTGWQDLFRLRSSQLSQSLQALQNVCLPRPVMAPGFESGG